MAGNKDIVEQALKLIFSGSKAVDETGAPVKLYHGTTKDVSVFKPGSYFTEDPSEGSAYTFWNDLKNADRLTGKYSIISAPETVGKRLEYFGTISDIDDPKAGEFYATDNGIVQYAGGGKWKVANDVDVDEHSLDVGNYTIGVKSKDTSANAQKMVDEYEEFLKRAYPGGDGGNVVPAYLNVKNPKEMSPLEGNRFGERLGADPKWVAEEIEKLKAQGYDSIVTTSDDPFYAMEGKKPPKQYVIFEPNQAKSAIGNTGEYDFTNPDITKSEGGSIREGYQTKGRVVGDVVEQALKLVMGEGDEAAKAFLMPKIRPTTDNIHDVGAANFDYYNVVGNKMMPIKNVFGGVDLSMPDQRARVDSLKAAISNPEKGYISRIIVDDEGNVIEGQHRLDALRELGASEIPVTMLRDRSRGVDVAALKSAIQQQGGIHPDQTNQIVDMILDGNPEEYEPPQGFEKWWNAGVGEYNKQRGRISKGPGGIIDDVVRLAGKVVSGEGDEAAKAGIRAYHGSPHDFDKFSMDKIGTGEGAQAYGHGLYFAGNEDVAKGYRRNLSGPESMGTVTFDGRPIVSGGSPAEGWDDPNLILGGDIHARDLAETMLRHHGNVDAAVSELRGKSQSGFERAQTVKNEKLRQMAVNSAKTASDMADLLQANPDRYGVKIPGHMYEVNIAADPNTFLDWDKPLSEQPQQVLDVARPFFSEGMPERKQYGEIVKGGDLYDMLAQRSGGVMHSPKLDAAGIPSQLPGGTKERLGMYLSSQGIPGIKYLDAGSRGAAQQTQSHMNYLKDRLNSTEASLDKMRANRYTPKRAIVQYEKSAADDRAQIAKLQSEIDNPTRNYVVFDDKLISIIRKYGIAGASAMVGYDFMENLDPKQALAATMADREYQSQKQAKANGGSVREGYQTKGRVVGDVVEQALKLLSGGEDAAQAAIRAYHGSPHKFGEFKFTPREIGSGEGAQAYGYGGYFAESEPLAESYTQARDWSYKGKSAQDIYDDLYSISRERGLDNEGWSKLNAQRGFWERVLTGRSPRSLIMEGKINPDDYGASDLAYHKTLDPEKFVRNEGHMYEVGISADPSNFVDWDKVISEQPEAFKEYMRDHLKKQGYLRSKDNGPRQLSSALKSWNMEKGSVGETPIQSIIMGRGNIGGGTPVGVSKDLQSLGVPGVKFLDSQSRGLGTGTRNYVVFPGNEDLVKIIRSYADGGEVDDDINDALRLAKEDGGSTGQVFMEDATGNKYDAQGNVIPPEAPGPNPQRSNGDMSATYRALEFAKPIVKEKSDHEVWQSFAPEVRAKFSQEYPSYAAEMRKQDVAASKKQVQAMPEDLRSMTHPLSPIQTSTGVGKVEMPLLGINYEFPAVEKSDYITGETYRPAESTLQSLYDFKTVPLYYTPFTAGPAAAIDVAEGMASGDPTTASLAVLFGPGGKYSKAAGIAGINYFMDPANAQAGPSKLIANAIDVAKAGIRAFHGSPHDFPPVRLIEMPDGTRLYQNMLENIDTPEGAKILEEYPLGRFDMSKLGTGEGAQAYGHGLYFAEAEPTARGYRDTLTDRASSFRVENIDMPKWILRGIENSPDKAAAIAKYREDFTNRLLEAQKEAEGSVQPWLASGRISSAKDVLAGLDALERGASMPHTAGRVYEVNIAADPNTFLDWNKPLSEHPQEVRDALQKYYGFSYPSKEQQGWTGKDVAQFSTMQPEHMKRFYEETKIPGIKYLDAGSVNITPPSIRQSDSGFDVLWGNDPRPVNTFPSREAAEAAARELDTRSRNYVIFDDKLISIIRKYGIAGASAMVGYNLMERLDPKQALAATMADEEYQANKKNRDRGGSVTGGKSYDKDASVAHALALTREY